MLTKAPTYFIVIGKLDYKKFTMCLNGATLPRVNQAKLLGIWIDDNLSWNYHVTTLLNKLKCGIGMLRRSKNLLTVKAKKLLYFGQIQSNLTYCLAVWGPMIQKQLLDKIIKIQRTALQLINPLVHVDLLFKKERILPIQKMIELEQCKMGYKLCHNLLPRNLAKCMLSDHRDISVQKVHKYQTRNKKTPNLPTAFSSKYRSSFLFTCIKEYSKLTTDLKDAKSLSIYVKCLKNKYIESL